MEGAGDFGLSDPAVLDAARNTLGAAVVAAATLAEPDARAALLATARDGFMQGMQWMAGLAVLTMLGAAWLAARVLKRADQPG